MDQARSLGPGFFHFCGTLGRPMTVGKKEVAMILCPICHSRAWPLLRTKDILNVLRRYDKQARELWEKAEQKAMFERRSAYVIFITDMRDRGLAVPL